jgi:hypothetical protein
MGVQLLMSGMLPPAFAYVNRERVYASLAES